jgi:chromosome segregation ATPase
MESMETRKAEIQSRIEEGVEVLNDLEDERGSLNASRDRALEEDHAELKSFHEQYLRGELKKSPIAYTANWDAIEQRATSLPKLIAGAMLDVAKAQLELAMLERGEALEEEGAPLEALAAIEGEVAQLESERTQAEEAVSRVRRRAEVKMEEEMLLRCEIHRLEEAVGVRTWEPARVGVVMG